MPLLLGESTMIKKRYFYLTEEILKKNPNICAYAAPSLNVRQQLKSKEIWKLGERAAMVAIKEWVQPKSNITHLIINTTSAIDMPDTDF